MQVRPGGADRPNILLGPAGILPENRQCRPVVLALRVPPHHAPAADTKRKRGVAGHDGQAHQTVILPYLVERIDLRLLRRSSPQLPH